MAIPLAGVLMPALAKVGAVKLPLLLRAAGVTAGALPGLRQGNLGQALVGGGLGALGTAGLGGVTTGLAGKAGLQAAKMAGSKGLGATAAGILGRAAVPLGVGALAGGSTAGILGGGVGNVGRGAAGLAGYGSVGGEGMGGSAVPPGMGMYGGVSPTGDPLSVLSPLGLDAGRRLRTVKDAEALRDAQNIVLPTVRKFAEQAKRDEFARSMAGAGIRQNIATQAALTENMQRAGLNLGMTAAQQAGDALTQRYNY
tara:strand:+ start:613 stop:1377 length:765 start_codon:yes stop_codon:yes gene_type:complete